MILLEDTPKAESRSFPAPRVRGHEINHQGGEIIMIFPEEAVLICPQKVKVCPIGLLHYFRFTSFASSGLLNYYENFKRKC